ncbi:hypothetical protein FE249_19960 (plasmid) [Acidiphilium multivorum]|uniref:hypothetical protein n=1 Tax=Acidiphilium multivorum TaxID=62140 RepID=UPI001F4C0C58|nr:hypothetical protein [Acidiphilium multivorum]UNC16457.1 hypothetical protein FE249_19960 [Acidiphilium multivorum]
MERKTIGLIGAIAGLAAAAPLYAAKAEAAPLPEAGSYAELLAPVSEPGMILRAHDAHLERARTEEPAARLMQIDENHHHHHHHHHHNGYQRSDYPRYNRRSEHHHHNQFRAHYGWNVWTGGN